MYIVGFTGKSAAGKGVAAEVLRDIAHIKSVDIEYSDLLIAVLNEWLRFISFKPADASEDDLSPWLIRLSAILSSQLDDQLPPDILTREGALSSELYDALLKNLKTIPSQYLTPSATITRETKDEFYLPLLNWLGRASRQAIGEDVWGRIMERHLQQLDGQNIGLVTIGGIRTPDAETLPIHSRGGVIVRVVRHARFTKQESQRYENDASIRNVTADAEIQCLSNYEKSYLHSQLVGLWEQIKNGRLSQRSASVAPVPSDVANAIVHSMILSNTPRVFELAAMHDIHQNELGQLARLAAKKITNKNVINTIQLMRWYGMAPYLHDDPALLAKIRRAVLNLIEGGEGLAYIVQYRTLLQTMGIEIPPPALEKALLRQLGLHRESGLLLKELGKTPILAEYFIKHLDAQQLATELIYVERAIHHRSAATIFLERFSQIDLALHPHIRSKLSDFIFPLAKYVAGEREQPRISHPLVLKNFFDTLKSNESIPQAFVEHILAHRASYATELLATTRRFFPNDATECAYFLWQGLEYYLRILENHRPLYETLYKELDDRHEKSRSLEVFIGRDAYYSFVGRMAQREARFVMGQDNTIEACYIVYPHSFRQALPIHLKARYLSQAGITHKADPVIVDVGYSGSVAEDILATLDYTPEEYDDHILLLSSSTPSRRLESLDVPRSFILEKIEHHPQLYGPIEGLSADHTGRVNIELVVESPENQLYATLSEKASHDYFFYQESLRLQSQKETFQPTHVKRVGLYSGTFDPIHLGHIEVAKAAMKAAHLDEVWFIVNASPRYKQNVSPFKDRLAMLKLVLQDEEGLHAAADAYQEEGQRHTIDTLEYMTTTHPTIVFVQINGIDSIAHLPSWTRCQELLKLTTFAIHRRSGVGDSVLHDVITRLGNHATNFRYITFDTQGADAASTNIRAAIRAGRIDVNLKPAVLAYAGCNGLYT